MFASLDRIDVVAEEDDGQRLAVQTDHRTPDEIEADWELSVIFTLTRALNPLRTDAADRVRFAFAHRPPEALVALIRRVGAELEIDDEAVLPGEPGDPDAIDALASDCLRTLGRATLESFGVEADEAGLITVQHALRERALALGKEEDELGYWTALVELGAVTGEVLQGFGEHAWVRDPDFYGMIPFILGRDGSLTNVFGKVERYFEQGPSQEPSSLLRIMEDSLTDVEEAPIMFNLRPADWAGLGKAWTRPLLDSPDEASLPVIALVRDMPSSVASIPGDLPEEQLEGHVEEAQRNLGALEVEVETLDVGFPVRLVHGTYYAAEKVLDDAFMRDLADGMETELLAVAMPAKGGLLVADALQDQEALARLVAVIAQQYDEAAPAERLSPTLFLWSLTDGLCGVARLRDVPGEEAPTDEATSPGLWSRLLSWLSPGEA